MGRLARIIRMYISPYSISLSIVSVDAAVVPMSGNEEALFAIAGKLVLNKADSKR